LWQLIYQHYFAKIIIITERSSHRGNTLHKPVKFYVWPAGKTKEAAQIKFYSLPLLSEYKIAHV